MRVGSENIEHLTTVVDRPDELQASSVGRRESVAARDSERETHGRPCRHIQSALPTGDGLWPLPRHVSWRSRKVAALCIRRTLCRHVTIATPMVIFLLFDCLLAVFDDWYTCQVRKDKT